MRYKLVVEARRPLYGYLQVFYNPRSAGPDALLDLQLNVCGHAQQLETSFPDFVDDYPSVSGFSAGGYALR